LISVVRRVTGRPCDTPLPARSRRQALCRRSHRPWGALATGRRRNGGMQNAGALQRAGW